MQQEIEQRSDTIVVRSVTDRAARALGADQPGPRQSGEMRGERVGPDVELLREIARAHALRSRCHEMAEDIQAVS